MKKSVAVFLSGFLFLSISAQEEVEFKFSRENVRPGSKFVFMASVNGVAAGELRNGDSLLYKAIIDLAQPVEVSVGAGIGRGKRVIFVYPYAGQKVVFEAGFFGGQFVLDLVSGASLKPGSGTVAGGRIDKTTLGISYVSTTTLASDTIRQQWVDKGGKMEGISNVGAASFTRMSAEGMNMIGGGLQTTMTVTYLNLKIPQNKPGRQTWNSGVYGYSLSNLLFVSRTKIDIEGLSPMTSTTGSYQIMLSANGGYTLGVGKFKNDTKWKGVAFELTYKPSLIAVMPFVENTKIDVQLNMAGFGFDINFNSFTSNAARLAPRAQSKFTFFMLPPIKKMPLFITVGYGRTFYRKIYPKSPTS